MKILGVAGTKNTGKTTLITLIVRELVNRGYHVGTIKHTHHEFDLNGKDTWKHRDAGAELVVGAGESMFFWTKNNCNLEKILKILTNLKNLDYIIIEGFKLSNYPKISTTKFKDDFTITNVNVFEMNQDAIISLVDLIEERTFGLIPNSDCGKCGYDSCLDMSKAIIKGKVSEDSCKMKKLDEVQLYIGDKMIPLNPFVQNFIKETIKGMVSTLKIDGENILEENVELYIKK